MMKAGLRGLMDLKKIEDFKAKLEDRSFAAKVMQQRCKEARGYSRKELERSITGISSLEEGTPLPFYPYIYHKEDGEILTINIVLRGEPIDFWIVCVGDPLYS